MSPTNEEIDAAIMEEAEAMRQLAVANQAETKASVKVKAARARLSLARAQKSALMNDLMTYGK